MNFKTDYDKRIDKNKKHICPKCKKEINLKEDKIALDFTVVMHRECFMIDNCWRPKSSLKVKISNLREVGCWTEAHWLGDPLSFIPYEEVFKDPKHPLHERYWEARTCDVCEDFGVVKPLEHKGIMMRANQFKSKYKYTKKGIYYSLLYHYKFKKGDPKKAKKNIGIVPYIYNDASSFWYWKLRREKESLERRKKAVDNDSRIVVYQGSQYELKNSWEKQEREQAVKRLFSEEEELEKANELIKLMKEGNL